MQHRTSRPVMPDVDTMYLSSQVQMMAQDFRDRIVPYSSNRRTYELSTCGISSHVVERSLGPIGITPDYFDSAPDFIRSITYSLLISQEVWLEITFGTEESGGAPFQVFAVEGVNQTKEGDIIQCVPSSHQISESGRRSESGRERILLPPDRMVHATLPCAYSSEVLNRVITELAEHDDMEVYRWGLAKVTGQDEAPRNFDFRDASRIKRLSLLQSALPIGWTAREIFHYEQNREMSEYYYYLRELQFLHFVASMREQAEGALYDVLTLAGERCGFTFSLTAQGIYTPDKVSMLIKQFTRGEIAFSALNDIIYGKSTTEQSSEKRSVSSN